MATAIANRYARALADLVLEQGTAMEPRQVVEQLRTVEAALASSIELRNVLANPAVPPPRKRAVVARLAELAQASPLVRNFLFVVINRRRISLLREMRESFEEMIDEHLGLVRAKVSSSGELNAEQRERLQQALSNLAGKQARCEFAVDENLLGGVLVQVGSTVYDGSVRGRLDALRQKLVE